MGCMPRKAARLLDCYFQRPDSCIRTNRKKMDALTDCTFIHMNQVQVIRHVAIMSDREQVYVSGSWLRQC